MSLGPYGDHSQLLLQRPCLYLGTVNHDHADHTADNTQVNRPHYAMQPSTHHNGKEKEDAPAKALLLKRPAPIQLTPCPTPLHARQLG